MSRWGTDATVLFVSEYLKHEALWNIKTELYKNRQAKQIAYEALQKVMNIPGFTEKEIKLKIKNIRSTYSQELKKIKDSRASGSDQVYFPSVKWFPMLDSSLKTIHSEKIRTPCNVKSQTELSECSAAVEEHFFDTIEDLTQHSISNISIEESIVTPQNKKQKIARLKTIVNQLKEVTETVNCRLETNEFEAFGRNIGLQLKAMPLHLALEAQQHIQSYLTNVRVQQLNSNKCYLQSVKNFYKSSPGSSPSTYSLTSQMSNTSTL